MGFGTKFSPLPYETCSTTSMGKGNNSLYCEAEGNSEYEKLMGLISDIVFGGLVEICIYLFIMGRI